MSTEMVRFVEVQGWQVAVEGVGDEEAKIRDIDLAKKLQYSRPRDIRRVILRLIAEGRLAGVCSRAVTARQSTGRGERAFTVTEYWLTEEQALKVIATSDTPEAKAILDQVIQVFVYVRKNGITSLSSADPAIVALQAKTAHLQASKPFFDLAFKQLEDLESRGVMDQATASAHRTQLLLTVGIDIIKAPMVQYESVNPRDTIALNSPLIENLKSPGDLPKTGIGFNSQVDRAGFYYANDLGREFSVSADVISKLSHAAGIFQKITPNKNEYGFQYNHPHGVEGKTKPAWMYSKKSREILRELVAQFHLSYSNRPTKKTSRQSIAAVVGKEWKDKQPLVEPTAAPLPN